MTARCHHPTQGYAGIFIVSLGDVPGSQACSRARPLVRPCRFPHTTPDHDRRVRIVCEDRRTERLLSKVCQRKKVGVFHVEIAPSGRGAAFTWIQRRYPEFVKLHRSKNYQKNLCLLVAIDGDNKGVSVRKLELEQELVNAKVEARKLDEPMAVFAPTWSIETWIASLVDGSPHHESLPLKEDNTVRHLSL